MIPISTTQKILKIILGSFLLLAGISHLSWARQEFLAQVPNWVPLNQDLVVILSGIVEILLGLSLILLKRYRIELGWIVALFFVAVFPGNISQYVNRIDAFGLNSDLSRLIRLFFQPVLIIWALWSTGAWKSFRNHKRLK